MLTSRPALLALVLADEALHRASTFVCAWRRLLETESWLTDLDQATRHPAGRRP